MIKRLLILVILLGGFFLLTNNKDEEAGVLSKIVKEGVQENTEKVVLNVCEGADCEATEKVETIDVDLGKKVVIDVKNGKKLVKVDLAKNEQKGHEQNEELLVANDKEEGNEVSSDAVKNLEVKTEDIQTDKAKKVNVSQFEVEKKGEKMVVAEAELNIEGADPAVGVYKGKEVETRILKDNGEAKAVEIKEKISRDSGRMVGNKTTNVKVYMYDNGIDFSLKNIPSGTVIFDVVNNSNRFSHTFVVDGVNYGQINAGQGDTIVISMTPGTYNIYSDKRNDAEFIYDQIIVK